MKNIEKVFELRRKLHDNPEKSFQEEKTQMIIKDFLKDNTSVEIVEKDKWFYAYKKSKDSQKEPIALRCDMDAICLNNDNLGHYCGHDGHCAILCNVAMIISNMDLDRDIYLIFQPAEEVGKGAILCRNLINEKKISEIYGLHNIPGFKSKKVLLRKSTFSCASIGLKIEYVGCPTHAAYPENGLNPAKAFAELIKSLDDITEKFKKDDEILLTTVIGLALGSESFGSSAYQGHLNITIRAEKQDSFDMYLQAIKDQANLLANKDGLKCSIKEFDYFPATINNEICVKKIEDICKKEKIEYEYLSQPMRWSEDFAYYSQICSSAFFGIGIGENSSQLHSSEYQFNDDIIEIATKILVDICCSENQA